MKIPRLVWQQSQAQQLIEATHQVCPYSNATRGNVETRLEVTVI
jgi:organic hydroperoxide reductase OsmC/OhrA